VLLKPLVGLISIFEDVDLIEEGPSERNQGMMEHQGHPLQTPERLLAGHKLLLGQHPSTRIKSQKGPLPQSNLLDSLASKNASIGLPLVVVSWDHQDLRKSQKVPVELLVDRQFPLLGQISGNQKKIRDLLSKSLEDHFPGLTRDYPLKLTARIGKKMKIRDLDNLHVASSGRFLITRISLYLTQPA
jgi:hypothetical protein